MKNSLIIPMLIPILSFASFIAWCAFIYYRFKYHKIKYEKELSDAQLKNAEESRIKSETDFIKYKRESEKKLKFAINNVPKFEVGDIIGKNQIVGIDVGIKPLSVNIAKACFVGLFKGVGEAIKEFNNEQKTAVYYKYTMLPEIRPSYKIASFVYKTEQELIEQKEAEQRLKTNNKMYKPTSKKRKQSL